MKGFYASVMLKLMLIGLIGSTASQEVNEKITIDEWAKDFPMAGTEAQEYEIVPIHTSRLQKRDLRGGTHIQLKAFGDNIKLWLNPTDGILAGDETPVYELRRGPELVQYNNAMKKIAARLYEDASHAATIAINEVEDNQHHLSGMIGSKNIYLRPIPQHMANLVRRYRRSLDNIADSEIGNYTYHIAYRAAELPEYFKYLEAPLRSSYRSKRAIQSTVYPEILVIVDYPLYKLFRQNIWEAVFYLLPFWNAVDLKFRSLEHPKFRLNIAGIVFAKDEDALQYMVANKYGAEDIIVDEALDATRSFMFKLIESIPIDKYDIAITMTSDHLCVISDNTCPRGILGLAFVGGACTVDKYYKQSLKQAIIHDNAGYLGIHTTAHELGHLFGALHDGSNHADCAHQNGHMMAGNLVFNGNSSDWSPCTLDDFEKFLSSGAKCLENKPNVRNPVHRYLPGKLMDADEQCKKLVGTNAGFTTNEEICRILYCQSPTDEGSFIATTEAAEGTKCGEGKICLHSECVFERDTGYF